MIQLSERAFGYFLIQCADEARGEVLNVGVVVYDAAHGDVESRVVGSLDRVQRTLPNVPVPQVRELLDHAHDAAERMFARGGIEALASLSAEPRGTLRFTPLRSVMANRLDKLADELLQRYVEMPHRGDQTSLARVRHGDQSDQPGGNIPTSRRVINSVETRLRRRFKLKEGTDYHTGVTVHARLTNHAVVPIWFPLRLKNNLYLDALEVKPEINRTLDNARAIALKVQEAHRGEPGARMSVLIRDPNLDRDGELARAILEEGAGEARDALQVSRYSGLTHLDNWMEQTLAPVFL